MIKLYHAPLSRSMRVLWLLEEMRLAYELVTAPIEPPAPKPGSPLRGPFLQWVHFADATAFTGLGNIAWHTRFRQDAERVADALADYRSWAEASLDTLERALRGGPYLLGAAFSAADVMVGYTVLVAKAMGLVGESHPAVDAYLARLTERPALRRALQA